MLIFGHYVSRGTVVLTLVEALIFGSMFMIFGYLAMGGTRGAGVTSFATEVALPTGLLMLCLMTVGGYQLDAYRSVRTMARRVACGAIGGSAAIILVHDVMTDAGDISHGLVLAALSGGLVAFIGRFLSGRSASLQQYLQRKVLVLGTGQRAAELWSVLEQVAGISVRFRGFLCFGEELQAERAADARLPAHLLRATDRSLAEFAMVEGINEIIVSFDSADELLPERDLLDCRLHGISVIDRTSFIERETGRIGLDVVNARWLIFSPGFRRGRLRGAIKRCCDIVVSGAALALVLPLLPIVALVIKLDSPGPVLFRQTRVGLLGKPFVMYKFRSMRQDAEADGKARWADKNDSRVTKVGRFLRLSRIDELPQLFNVLKGDMSLVGPRPERPEFVDGLVLQIPFYMERHSVRPGITGWAQTSYPYAATIEDTKAKLEYDLYYVKNNSLFLDMVVLIQTFRVAVRGVGSR
jgi:sugar transferase (PEP-CTERM system associated)